jgi:hypothetical protein
VFILILEFNLYIFSLFSCKVRNHIASHSKFISLCHMMLLMTLLWSNMFYLNRYTSYLKWGRKEKDLSHIEKFKWFMHINGSAQIAKYMSHVFLSSDLSYIILSTKLWCELSTILHWIIMPNQKSFNAWHVSRGSQLHNLDCWD